MLQELAKFCCQKTLSSATEMADLSSNHEEANTKVVLHCANALSASKGSAVILCSPFGHTDINVLTTALLQNYMSRLFIECGSRSYKKGCWLKDFTLNEAGSSALLGLQETFTNHDWDEFGNIWWTDQGLPDGISGIFFNNSYDDKQFEFGSDSEKSEGKNED